MASAILSQPILLSRFYFPLVISGDFVQGGKIPSLDDNR